jgi:hypothetical protein
MIRGDDWLGEEVNKRVDGRRGTSVQDLGGNERPGELVRSSHQREPQQLSGTEEDDVCGFPTRGIASEFSVSSLEWILKSDSLVCLLE